MSGGSVHVTPAPPHHGGTEPPPRPLAAKLLGGWGKATMGAIATMVIAGVMAELIAVLAYTAEKPRPEILPLARFGGLLFYAFNRVGLVFSGGDFAGVRGGVSVTAAVLTGTLVIVLLLARTGREIGQQVGGSVVARGLHGTKVAVPYALACFGLAFLVTLPEGGLRGSPRTHPSYLGALLWPLAWGVTAGFVGGLRSAPRRSTESAGSRLTRAALSGGLAMLGLGLLLGFIALVALAPFQPDATRGYFGPFETGATDGLALIYITLLGLPNVVSVLVLFPAMNVCTTVAGDLAGYHVSACLLDYTHWPRRRDIDVFTGVVNLHGPPSIFYLFVLVPVVTVVLGGVMAARRARPSTIQESVGSGALAGAVFGVASLVLAFLATIGAKAGAGLEGLPTDFHVNLGPSLGKAVTFGLLWGVVGGAIGGLIHGLRLSRAHRLGQPVWEDTSGFTI